MHSENAVQSGFSAQVFIRSTAALTAPPPGAALQFLAQTSSVMCASLGAQAAAFLQSVEHASVNSSAATRSLPGLVPGGGEVAPSGGTDFSPAVGPCGPFGS